MTLGDVDGNAVRAEDVLCSRRVEHRDVGIRVVYDIRAAADGRVLVTDRLHGVDPDGFAFDPEHEPEQWAMQDETVAFKVPISADERATYVYGVKTDDPEDLLIRDPTLERVDDAGSPGARSESQQSTNTAQNRGVLAGFGTELRSAVRRVSGDAGGPAEAGTVAQAGIDKEAAAELEAQIEEFEHRLESLEVERARQAIDPLEERVAELADRVNSMDETLADVDGRVERLEAGLEEVRSAASAPADDVQRLEGALEAVQDRTEELESTKTEVTERLQSMEARAKERGAALDRVTERVETVETQTNRVAEAQERLEDRLGSLADGIERFDAMWNAMETAMEEEDGGDAKGDASEQPETSMSGE